VAHGAAQRCILIFYKAVYLKKILAKCFCFVYKRRSVICPPLFLHGRLRLFIGCCGLQQEGMSVCIQEGARMDTLVEKIVSLENEADSIIAGARAEAQKLEKSVSADIEAYRRKLSEDTEAKVSLFQKQMEERHKVSVVEAEGELVRSLGAVDQIADNVLREQIDRIVNKFCES
jgi:hypothetical protein